MTDQNRPSPPRHGQSVLEHRVRELELRQNKEVLDHQEQLRELRGLVEDIRRQLAMFEHTRESLGRAFSRIEALETRDRHDGEARAELRGTMESVAKALATIEQSIAHVPALDATVKHHARALWLIAGTFVTTAGALVVKWVWGG